MDASFVVTCSTGMPSIMPDYLFSAYPNPFFRNITIEVADTEMIILCNAAGEKIKSVSLNNRQTKVEVDAAELNIGIYFYNVIRNGAIVKSGKIIKQ